MKFLIYPNETRERAAAFGAELTAWLTERGHTCVSSGGDLQGVGMVIAIGGDGTVLRAVRETYGLGIPCWSINYGTLGYLAECQPEEAKDRLELILGSRYGLERRFTMSGRLLRQDNTTQRFFAINEAVIYRSSFAHMVRVNLSIGGNEITSYAGDGLLVGTPTGSTAYNLSAGGPILMPDSEQLVITPICSHSALSAPLVVSKQNRISIDVSFQAADDEPGAPELVIDGLQRFPLREGDRVECSLSPISVDFVKTGDDSFYRKLQQRLSALQR